MGMTEQGIDGEQKLKRYCHSKGIKFFQPDGIGLDLENYTLYECKCLTEAFKPPPFYGHGLWIYQVNDRLNFQMKTGIRVRFIVFQVNDGTVYSAWLDELDKGDHYDTKNGIRIYPVENFDLETFEPPPADTAPLG